MITPATSKYMSASSPARRTTADQPKAASVPIEISVSIVAVPCRALRSAARWNGQPAQTTTGVASASATHSHPSNWSGGTIESSDERSGQDGGDERAAPPDGGACPAGLLARQERAIARRLDRCDEIARARRPASNATVARSVA